MASSSGTFVMPELQANYSDLLNRNQANYGQILNAYAQGRQTIAQSLPGISQAYGYIGNQIQNTLGLGGALGGNNWGVATPAAQAISRTYQEALGRQKQQLINSGLGSTTLGAALGNKLARSQAESYGALGAQLADKAAGYQAQIGLAQQAAQMQGLGMLAQNFAGQGSTLGGYRFANTYGNVTGQQSFGDGGYGGGRVGGFGGVHSSPGDQGLPMGGRFGNSVAPPGASGYSGGAGSTYLGQQYGYGYPQGGGTAGQPMEIRDYSAMFLNPDEYADFWNGPDDFFSGGSDYGGGGSFE